MCWSLGRILERGEKSPRKRRRQGLEGLGFRDSSTAISRVRNFRVRGCCSGLATRVWSSEGFGVSGLLRISGGSGVTDFWRVSGSFGDSGVWGVSEFRI